MENLRKQYNEKLRVEAESKDFLHTLWLSNVERVYKEYDYDLGWNRKGKPGRKKRPCVVVGSNDNQLRFIFLTTMRYSNNIGFKIKECVYQYCLSEFSWNEEISFIFLKYGETSVRKIFIFMREDLDKLMEFCGICRDLYVEKIYARLRRWKKKTVSLRY